MSIKPKWDLTINIPVIVLILSGILAMGAQQANNITVQRQVDDHERRIRAVEGPVIERLIRVEEQNKTAIEMLGRIDRRMDGGK